MSKNVAYLPAVLAAALFLIHCGGPATDVAPAAPEAPPPAADTGPDPTVVDPAHYTVEFENDRVRVVRIRYGAGEESVMHFHPEGVAVFLTDHAVQMTLPDGSTADMSGTAGAAAPAPAGQHLPRNVGDAPLEVVQVELKGAPAAAASGGDDPTVVDAAHYATEFETDRLRVLRIRYAPGEESVMHVHPDGVAVFLTDHEVEMTLPDGTASVARSAAGDVAWVPAGSHLPRNVADTPVEVVLVELK